MSKSKSLQELEEKYYGKTGTVSRVIYEREVAKEIAKAFVQENTNLKKLSAIEKKKLSHDIATLNLLMKEPKLIKRCREQHNKLTADKNPYTADCIMCGDCRRAYQAELEKYYKFLNNRNNKIISLKRISSNQVSQLKNIVVIDYEWWAGKCNQGFYRATYNGETYHHTKERLIKDANKAGREWLVLRWHKDRSSDASIIEKSKKIKSKSR